MSRAAKEGKKLKIALCFFGTVGKTSLDNEAVRISISRFLELNKKTLFYTEVDVFAHCWGNEIDRREIISLLKPKSVLVEPAEHLETRTFSVHRMFYFGIKEGLSILRRVFLRTAFRQNQILYDYRLHSRWLSVYKSISLLKAYENTMNVKYDVVMSLRYDISFYNKFPYEQIVEKKLYAGNWNNLPREENSYELDFVNMYKGEGFIDLWFAGTSEVMTKFSKLYFKLDKLPVSQHFASGQYWKCYMSKDVDVEYILYRWIDFELIRSKEDKILPPHI